MSHHITNNTFTQTNYSIIFASFDSSLTAKGNYEKVYFYFTVHINNIFLKQHPGTARRIWIGCSTWQSNRYQRKNVDFRQSRP